jgi:prepilin-type N-terminal cleavage/methylation domain-containing protein
MSRPPGGTPHAAARGPWERGETLIELLITVAILGLGSAAILGGTLTAVASSTLHRHQAQAQALLRSWAEQVADVTDSDWVPCAPPGAYARPAPATIPTGFTAEVAAVQYWDPATAAFSSSCGMDSGVQRVELTVTMPSGGFPGALQSLAVVVRRPCRLPTSC